MRLLLLLIMECVRPCRSTCCHPDETPSRYCCRQPTITPSPFPATANFPAAEWTRLSCEVALPHQTTLLVGCTRLAAVRLTEKYADMFPLVSDYTHCCCRGVHTATPCDLKSPIHYARRGCPRLNSHRGASAAAVLPSVRRDTTLPACSYAFTIGKFRRWGHSSHPCSTLVGDCYPPGTPCAPRSNGGIHLNQVLGIKALLQYPRQ